MLRISKRTLQLATDDSHSSLSGMAVPRLLTRDLADDSSQIVPIPPPATPPNALSIPMRATAPPNALSSSAPPSLHPSFRVSPSPRGEAPHGCMANDLAPSARLVRAASCIVGRGAVGACGSASAAAYLPQIQPPPTPPSPLQQQQQQQQQHHHHHHQHQQLQRLQQPSQQTPQRSSRGGLLQQQVAAVRVAAQPAAIPRCEGRVMDHSCRSAAVPELAMDAALEGAAGKRAGQQQQQHYHQEQRHQQHEHLRQQQKQHQKPGQWSELQSQIGEDSRPHEHAEEQSSVQEGLRASKPAAGRPCYPLSPFIAVPTHPARRRSDSELPSANSSSSTTTTTAAATMTPGYDSPPGASLVCSSIRGIHGRVVGGGGSFKHRATSASTSASGGESESAADCLARPLSPTSSVGSTEALMASAIPLRRMCIADMSAGVRSPKCRAWPPTVAATHNRSQAECGGPDLLPEAFPPQPPAHHAAAAAAAAWIPNDRNRRYKQQQQHQQQLLLPLHQRLQLAQDDVDSCTFAMSSGSSAAARQRQQQQQEQKRRQMFQHRSHSMEKEGPARHFSFSPSSYQPGCEWMPWSPQSEEPLVHSSLGSQHEEEEDDEEKKRHQRQQQMWRLLRQKERQLDAADEEPMNFFAGGSPLPCPDAHGRDRPPRSCFPLPSPKTPWHPPPYSPEARSLTHSPLKWQGSGGLCRSPASPLGLPPLLLSPADASESSELEGALPTAAAWAGAEGGGTAGVALAHGHIEMKDQEQTAHARASNGVGDTAADGERGGSSHGRNEGGFGDSSGGDGADGSAGGVVSGRTLGGRSYSHRSSCSQISSSRSSSSRSSSSRSCITTSSSSSSSSNSSDGMDYMCHTFKAEDLKEATNHWSENNVLGKGSFGTVYKGHILGQVVAIKRLETSSKQGSQEYETELNLLSRMRHPNIVRLIGHCPEECSLVYEYLPGGSLQDCLNKSTKGYRPLSPVDLVNMLIQIASGLLYLHQADPPIVHRDLKPDNVLLTRDGTCKLGDVGLARLVEGPENITYRVAGTVGYIDPESMTTFRISPAMDVFALGMIILQLVTGEVAVTKLHRHIDNRCGFSATSEGTWLSRAADAVLEMLDEGGGHCWPREAARRLAVLGLRCASRRSCGRPRVEEEVLPELHLALEECQITALDESCTVSISPVGMFGCELAATLGH